jgi:predicted amidohydrolase YtcJ
VQHYADGSAEPSWILGAGWHFGDFASGIDAAALLDTVSGSRPAYLVNADHHSAWVNSVALECAGITADTQDPPDGIIERRSDGAPNGILHEGAMELLAHLIPERSPAQLAHGLSTGVGYLHSLGVTGWQEAILGDYAGYADVSTAYLQARRDGVVTETATGALWVRRDLTVEAVPALVRDFVRRREENARAGFTTRTAKIMVDGVPENRTAALLERYCRCEGLDGGPSPTGQDGRGLAYLDLEVLLAVGTALDAAGFDLHFHAIGDRAVRWALDTVGAIRSARPSSTGRHHLAHLQIVHPDDVPRFATTGTTANLQALWACNSDQMQDITAPLLGPERVGWQYPFRSIQESGGQLCMGSDWPVSTPDPWQALHVAVNRSEPPVPGADVGTGDRLTPGEALDLTTALAAYTSGSAWQLRLDGPGAPRGRIIPGAVADLAVADRNPFDAVDAGDATRISSTRNVLTLVSGKVVHDAR